jgi:hypothetical protein
MLIQAFQFASSISGSSSRQCVHRLSVRQSEARSLISAEWIMLRVSWARRSSCKLAAGSIGAWWSRSSSTWASAARIIVSFLM